MNQPGQRALLIVGLALVAAGALLGVVSAVGDAAVSPVASAQQVPRQPGFEPGTGRHQPGEGPWFPGRRPFGRPTPSPAPSP